MYRYQWDPMNTSWLPSTSPVPIGGFVTSAQAAAAAAAATAAAAAAANINLTETSGSGTTSSSSEDASSSSTSLASSRARSIRPQSFAHYESIVTSGDSSNGQGVRFVGMSPEEINQYLYRQWNLDLAGTFESVSTDSWRKNMNNAKKNYQEWIQEYNKTWHQEIVRRSGGSMTGEENDWTEALATLAALETINQPNQYLNYYGVAKSYPDPLLAPKQNGIVYGRSKAGKTLNSIKSIVKASIVPNYLSTVDEIYAFLQGPLRRAVVAVREKEANAMRTVYLGQHFWKTSVSDTTNVGGSGRSTGGSTSSFPLLPNLQGRPTPYDQEEVLGRTDAFNNSYIHLNGRPVGPGIVLEQRKYIRTTDCPSQTSLGKETQDIGSLECQLSISNEWEQAPKSIITADITDTYTGYHRAMYQLRKSNWLKQRETAEVRMSGVIYNPNTNLALLWTLRLKRPSSMGTIFLFDEISLRVVQLDQLNTPIQRAVGILLIICLCLLGYVAKVEVDRCKHIKVVSGHYRGAMRSVSLWGAIIMIILFVLHLLLRAVYFFDFNRKNFDISSKDLTLGLPNMSFVEIFEMEHIFLAIVSALAWFRMLNYLMLNSRIRFTLKVLKNSFKKSLFYLLLFSVPILAYSLFGYYVFGPRVANFHTFPLSLETVLVMAFGSFQDDVLSRYPNLGALYLFSFYLVVVFLMRTLFTAIVIDTYKREALKYEKRPPPNVKWSCIGIVGAIIPSCNPRSNVIESDPIERLPGISHSMALKLIRFELKTVKDLAELKDSEVRLFALKSEFITQKRLTEFRQSAMESLSSRNRDNVDRRGMAKMNRKEVEMSAVV